MDTVIIRDIDGKIVSRSRNLRMLLEHMRKRPLAAAVAHKNKAGAILFVRFSNRDWCETRFASYEVCCDLLKRKHALKGMRKIETAKYTAYYSVDTTNQ